jgi:hypothetical protein
LYNLTLTFASSNETFTQTVNVTDCKNWLNITFLGDFFIYLIFLK